jgi:predicted HTH domain antitoxin
MERTVTISYRDELLDSLGMTPEQFEKDIPLLIAGKLYESAKLTAGQAAELIGMDKVEFLRSLKLVGICASNLRPEDIEADIEYGRGFRG